MANHARALLEDALRSRKLDRTLTTALPVPAAADAAAAAPTGVEPLDTCLRGGLPRGQLSEIAGPSSSGRTTLLIQSVAAATGRGEIAAVVDGCDRLDVASLAAAGVDLDRLLWIRAEVPVAGSDAGDRSVERSLKALNLVLQAGGFGLVALDLGDVPLRVLRRIPFTTWPRIQRIVEGRDTACVLVVPQPMARSAGGVTLALEGQSAWAGTRGRSRRLDGLDVTVRVISPRRRMEGTLHVRGAARG